MVLSWVDVSTLGQLQGLLADGVPQLLHIAGVETVRSAAAMLPLIEGIHGVIIGQAVGDEGEVGIGGGSSSSSEDGDAAGEVDDGDEADFDDDDHHLQHWIVEGVAQLRRVTRLANLAIQMADDVIPALAATPGDVATLNRLRDLGEDVRRAGLQVPGAAGARAVTLGNRTQKLVSHAFKTRRGVPRSAVDRGTWIANRRANLLDKVNGLLDTAVVLEYVDWNR